MNFRAALSLLSVLVFLNGCVGTPPGPREIALPDALFLAGMDDRAAAEAAGIARADWGYLVIDAKSGEILESRNADRGFPPASTAKLPTMIAALGVLGPTHRFTTQVLAHGTLRRGVLLGDLVLTGDGDPLLTAGDLRALVIRMHDIGIERVEGRFIYTSALPVLAEVEPTQPKSAPYNQGLGGLNIEFNRVPLSRPADGPPYTTPPEAGTVVPEVAESSAPSTELPVRAPGRLAALMMQRFALAEGISLPDPESGTPPPGAVSLAQIRSQPLIEIARAGLEYSNNMIAEVTGLAASRALGSGAETLRGSADTLGIWLEREVKGLSGFTTALENHSGLSTVSRTSPAQMAAILRYAVGRRFDGWRFDSLLTPGGARDTLRGRFRDPDSAYRVWAKSGTMRYINGLAGYLDAHSGRRLIFALFVHDPVLRAKLEADPDRYGLAARRISSDWRNRTDAFEAGLIIRWLRNY